MPARQWNIDLSYITGVITNFMPPSASWTALLVIEIETHRCYEKPPPNTRPTNMHPTNQPAPAATQINLHLRLRLRRVTSKGQNKGKKQFRPGLNPESSTC
jgi:hypothetical protein